MRLTPPSRKLVGASELDLDHAIAGLADLHPLDVVRQESGRFPDLRLTWLDIDAKMGTNLLGIHTLECRLTRTAACNQAKQHTQWNDSNDFHKSALSNYGIPCGEDKSTESRNCLLRPIWQKSFQKILRYRRRSEYINIRRSLHRQTLLKG